MNLDPALILTGERTLPGIAHENYWFRRHEAVYRWLAPRVAVSLTEPGNVLDAGAGEGYGAELLRRGGSFVVAVDYDESAADHVHARYPAVASIRGNLVALPVLSGSFDAVVSLQTIEHLWDQPLFVAECARVLRPGGLLAVSTPNRLTFSPGVGRGEKPLNPFHCNELDPTELVDLIRVQARPEAIVGINHAERIAAWEARNGGLVAAQLAGPVAHWSVELATFVGSISFSDFEISDSANDASLDLLVLARA